MLTYVLCVHCQAAPARMIFEICSVITYLVTLVIRNCPAHASLFTVCCEVIVFVHYLAALASIPRNLLHVHYLVYLRGCAA
jgi:hypothetical protein